MSFKIIGTGSSVPARIITNDELSHLVDTNDEWISSRTGIKQRRICTDETTSDICYKAAVLAIENAGISADELDLIICATITADYVIPSLACTVQKRINASCPAFDINAACSGFIYAFDIASAYFTAGKAKNILVVAGDSMSKILDWNDRATCVLFGDGAGAAVLAQGDDLLSIRITALGDDKVLMAPNISGKCPFDKKTAKEQHVNMCGQDTYKFAVNSMCNDIAFVLEKAGIAQQEVDYILPHQANIRIIDAAISRLKIPKERYITNIQYYGNTSAASVAILLDEANRNGILKKGDVFVLNAFGGGLTSGACVIKWSK